MTCQSCSNRVNVVPLEFRAPAAFRAIELIPIFLIFIFSI